MQIRYDTIPSVEYNSSSRAKANKNYGTFTSSVPNKGDSLQLKSTFFKKVFDKIKTTKNTQPRIQRGAGILGSVNLYNRIKDTAFDEFFLWRPEASLALEKLKGLDPVIGRLWLGWQINKYLNSIILQSNSRRALNVELLDKEEDLKTSPYQKFVKDIDFAPNPDEYLRITDYFVAVSYHCSKYSVANCRDFAILAYIHLSKNMKRGVIPYHPLHLCRIENGNHVFLIMGDLDNEDAVICDVLKKEVYPISQHKTRLNDYCYDPKLNKASWRPLDLNKQRIVPWIPKSRRRD